jgi:hypothetical protein
VSPFRCLLVLAFAWAAHAAEPAAAVADMAAAAQRLLAALPAELKAKAQFAWGDEERFNFHFIPRDRKGVPLKELNAAQRHLAYGLLNAGLSQRGYLKATAVMSLEQVLQDMEGPNRRFPRDPELYFVSVFGTPDARGTWGWRVEGHHLAVNFTVVDGRVAAGTPSFLGSNPGEVRTGPRAGLRTLGAEEDLARALVKSLTPAQRARAVLSEQAPDDILTVAQRQATLTETNGLPAAELTAAQGRQLRAVMDEYVGRLRGELAAEDWRKIEAAGFDRIRFAWAGSLEPGQRHYYRVHGPTFLLEYDNTQNDANHVHAVWRDFANDYGLDVLAAHLKAGHGK